MTERVAIRILWAATLVAAAVLVAAVDVLEASDEALVYGTVAIVIVSSSAAGYVTSHYSASHRSDD